MTGDETDRYPRVLLVSHEAFAPRGNGGIVICNLFEGWPSKNLAVVDYSNSAPALERCGRYWRLSKAAIMEGMIGRPPDGALHAVEGPPGGVAGEPTSDRGSGRRRLGVHIRRPIGEALFRLPGVVSGPLRRWVSAFNPEVCVSTLGSGLILRTVVRIADGAAIPIVPYFMDDWISTRYQGDVFERWLRSSARHWFRECLKRAPVRLVVTGAMAEEYERRYGGGFLPMEYAVARTVDPVPRRDRRSEPVRLVYMGGLAPGRAPALREIGEALVMLFREGIRVEFLIYAPAVEVVGLENMLNLPPVMKTMDTVPYGDVQGILSEADVVVHAESFDPAYRLWTRYSMSTKIPEYMMAGRCILAYGPAEIASIRYIREMGAGVVAHEADAGALQATLRTLLCDRGLRRRLGARARDVAVERHEAGRQRVRFLRAIRLASGRDSDAA